MVDSEWPEDSRKNEFCYREAKVSALNCRLILDEGISVDFFPLTCLLAMYILCNYASDDDDNVCTETSLVRYFSELNLLCQETILGASLGIAPYIEVLTAESKGVMLRIVDEFCKYVILETDIQGVLKWQTLDRNVIVFNEYLDSLGIKNTP